MQRGGGGIWSALSRNRRSKYAIVLTAAAIVSLPAGLVLQHNADRLALSPTTSAQTAYHIPDVVTIGSLLPISGSFSNIGISHRSALELAVSDFNKYLESQGAHWQMNAVIEDTQTNPIIALEKIRSLDSKGINLIIGPQTSSELRNIRGYIDDNNLVVISQSTSSFLALDDSIFRLWPTTISQGEVIAKLLNYNNITVMIPVYREDIWGSGMARYMADYFEESGGIVSDGIGYSVQALVFSVEAQLLSNIVDQYSAEYATDEIGIVMLGFGEVTHFVSVHVI